PAQVSPPPETHAADAATNTAAALIADAILTVALLLCSSATACARWATRGDLATPHATSTSPNAGARAIRAERPARLNRYRAARCRVAFRRERSRTRARNPAALHSADS